MLPVGARIGGYEIVDLLGEGGMGQVYRARDAKLHRDVALKVLPDIFASDPDRLARFVREAQVLASLNHPNIAHIHGFEEHATPAGPVARALVLELVEGPTLADRIARGPMPLRDAIGIAKQIVDALDTAHEQGIVHRDLKPANVKVKDDGTVKVLDFGLAKALAPDPASADAMNSPTITARQTEMGMILGTAAYMAPEQAKGKVADRRADVWAFGVVLIEMLTGRQVFTGETAPEVMASVMKEEPDWTRLPPNLPASIQRLLRRALEKDPKKRLSSMSDVRLELNDSDATPMVPVSASGGRTWLRLGAAAIAGAIVTAAAFLFVVPALRSSPAPELTRVSVLGPVGMTLSFDAMESAISPDGRMLVFTTVDAKGATMLWLRPLASRDSHALPGTEAGHLAFWSPDSREIGFFSDGKLKKVSASGGTVDVLCDAKDGRGGAWGTQNTIVFAPANGGALQMVSANGGDPKPATTLDATRGETGHRFPSFLPDGRHFVFATLPAHNQKFDVFVGSVDGTRSSVLLSAQGTAVYAEPGYLLFSRQDVLVAQRFDPATQRLSGEPVAISDVPSSAGGLYSAGGSVSASRTGVLAYLGDRLANTTLTWFDRTGRAVGTLAAPEGRYQEVVFSPDGKRAAITRFATQNQSDIWIADLGPGGTTRFTSTPGLNIEVLWSPNGDRVLFASDRAGARDFFVKPASGAQPEQSFFSSKALFKDLSAWSSDGKYVLFFQLDPETNQDLWLLPTDGDRKPISYLRTPYNETQGTLSPDGKWLAYLSDESGRYELYVDSFPTPRRKFKVTDQGVLNAFSGNNLAWRKDGRELSMLGTDARTVLVSDVSLGSEFHAGAPHALMTLPKETVAVQPTPDFQRFLAAVPVTDNNTSTLTVVFNWLGALGKK
jgi:serine/threonine protein kinase/Tol biopolymer transport system component